MIEKLENIMAIRRLGARILSGLEGDVPIPRQTGGATSYWVGEGASVTESQQSFDQIKLTPKTIGALTELTRKLIMQSSEDIESLVREDLALRLALGIDLAAINGSGVSGQPRGILNTTGIGDVAGGTNGLAPAWTHLMSLKKEVNKDNALRNALGYLTNADVEYKLETVEKASSTGKFLMENGKIGAYNVEFSNQVPNDLDKGTSTGVCSAIIFGNFNDLLIGEWGTIDINIDTSTLSASGGTRIVALKDVDMAVRHPESFAAMKDALTT
jgi:HK97 family phage major capsid protein